MISFLVIRVKTGPWPGLWLLLIIFIRHVTLKKKTEFGGAESPSPR